MDSRRVERFLKYLLVAILVLFSLLHLLRTVTGNDFFWHLRTVE